MYSWCIDIAKNLDNHIYIHTTRKLPRILTVAVPWQPDPMCSGVGGKTVFGLPWNLNQDPNCFSFISISLCFSRFQFSLEAGVLKCHENACSCNSGTCVREELIFGSGGGKELFLIRCPSAFKHPKLYVPLNQTTLHNNHPSTLGSPC